jgi:hypothetical protein
MNDPRDIQAAARSATMSLRFNSLAVGAVRFNTLSAVISSTVRTREHCRFRCGTRIVAQSAWVGLGAQGRLWLNPLA